MIHIEKIIVRVLIKEDEENVCAKCCKTVQVIERMMEEISEFKDKVEIIYEDIFSKSLTDKYGELKEPVIIVNDIIFSQEHVPIMKKLSRRLLELLKQPE